MKEETWKTWWEEHADPETFLQVQQPRTRNVRLIIYDMMKSILKPEDSILDVACGPARDYNAITEMGYKWVGVDMTTKFVNYVRDTYGAEMHQMNVTEGLNFKRGEFTMSYAKDLFEHLEPNKWRKVVSDMWSVSKKYMLLSFFRPPNENETVYRTVKTGGTAGVYSHQYSRKEFADYIRNMEGVDTVSIKESLLYKKKEALPRGYSIWLVKRV